MEVEILFDTIEEEVEYESESTESEVDIEVPEQKRKANYISPISKEKASEILKMTGTLVPNTDNDIYVVNGPVEVSESIREWLKQKFFHFPNIWQS